MKKTDYYSNEKTLAEFEHSLSLYRQRNNQNFLSYSQLLVQHSFLYALDYVCEQMKQEVKTVRIINAFPVLETKEYLLLVLPFLDDELLKGISGKNIGIKIPLENILYDYYQMKDGKKMPAKILVINYYSNNVNGHLVSTMTCFGKKYLREPLVLSIDELMKKEA